MTKITLILACFSVFLVSCAHNYDLKTVSDVDLNSYVGDWYEVASIPAWFQRDCTTETKANYSLLENGQIEVTNSCKKSDGNTKTANGRAKQDENYKSNSKLNVTFVKLFGLWVWPFGGDYWIMHLADDYSYSVVGEPSMKYLWILSRSKILPVEKLKELESKIASTGYDTAKIIITQPGAYNKRPLSSI